MKTLLFGATSRCHTPQFCQIRSCPLFFVLVCKFPCPVGNCGKIVIFFHIWQICQYRQLFWAPLLLSALPCWQLWQNCHVCRICQICQYRQLLWWPPHCSLLCPVGDCGKIVIFAILPNFPVLPTFICPLVAFRFALLAIVAKLSFLPYLPNSPISPTFMVFFSNNKVISLYACSSMYMDVA